MPPTYREDPYGAFNFQVVVKGIADDGTSVRGGFAEVSGLEVEIGVIEYRNGNQDIHVRKAPGLLKHSNIVLRRGVTGDLGFWKWMLTAISGQVRRAEMNIVLLDENHQEVMRWVVKRAWPCKWTGPVLNASRSEVAIESLEIAHEGFAIDGQADG